MKKIYRSIGVTVLATIVFGGIYPMIVYFIGRLAFPSKSSGTLVYREEKGRYVGSFLIAQSFTEPKYLHPRPSSAGKDGYDAMASSGSNLATTSQKLHEEVAGRVKLYRAENMLHEDEIIPGDAVMASGSGLDPSISLQNALLQAERIATARNLLTLEVKKLIRENAEFPYLGLFGDASVNVLKANLALDCISSCKKKEDLFSK